MKPSLIHSTLFLTAWLLLGHPGLASAQDAVKFSEVLQKFSLQTQQQCTHMKTLSAASKDEDRLAMGPALSASCSCLPEQIELLKQSAEAETQYSQSDANARIKRVVSSCTAKALRNNLVELCPLDKVSMEKVSDGAGFCACFQASLQQLSDTAIAESAAIKYRNFKKIAAAKAQGLAPLDLENDAVESAMQACYVRFDKRVSK